MIKPLTKVLHDFDIKAWVLHGSVDLQARVENEQLQTGGLDRASFVEMLFGDIDPMLFPVGHLMDHRVRMSLQTAEKAFAMGADEVRRILRRMLSMSANPTASCLIAKALGRRPRADAALLCKLHTQYPEFAALCLSGRLGDFSASVPVPAAEAFTAPVEMMAVYYGALELQLVALRPWAIEQFRIGLDGGGETSAMAQHSRDILALYQALEFLAKYVATGTKSCGRRPDLINSLRPKADQALASIKKSYPWLSDNEILRLTNDLFARTKAVRQSEQAKFEAMHKALAKTIKGQQQPLRKRSSTVAAGVEAGEQIAFAAVRLLALASGVAGAIKHPVSRHRTNGLSCFGQPPVWNDRRFGTLYLVSMRLLRQDPLYGPLLDSNGAHADLSSQIRIAAAAGSTIGEETHKSVRETHKSWFGRNTPVRGTGLIGSCSWDMLPCFRFSSSQNDPPWTFTAIPSPHALLESL